MLKSSLKNRRVNIKSFKFKRTTRYSEFFVDVLTNFLRVRLVGEQCGTEQNRTSMFCVWHGFMWDKVELTWTPPGHACSL